MQTQLNKSSRMWILYAVTAMIFFSSGNIFLAVVTAKVGPFSYLYWCIGSLIVCIIQHMYKSLLQYRDEGLWWVDLNFIVEGKLKWINLIGFSALTLNLLINY